LADRSSSWSLVIGHWSFVIGPEFLAVPGGPKGCPLGLPDPPWVISEFVKESDARFHIEDSMCGSP
jgi:hypothetical protein